MQEKYPLLLLVLLYMILVSYYCWQEGYHRSLLVYVRTTECSYS